LFDEACLYAIPALAEPWGLVYAEALATKTPILGLKRTALPNLTNSCEYGFLVEDAIPEAVTTALLDAVSNPARLQKMSENGQKYCLENFFWERTGNLIADAVFA
jgi:glycosyltransferase involved in cell wall biosynthesis